MYNVVYALKGVVSYIFKLWITFKKVQPLVYIICLCDLTDLQKVLCYRMIIVSLLIEKETIWLHFHIMGSRAILQEITYDAQETMSNTELP